MEHDTKRITILVDDRSIDTALVAEHGFSLWIEGDGVRILFDAGQSDACIHNAKAWGIDPARATHLILSHGHYDHTGAVGHLLEHNPAMRVVCHAGVFAPRYSRQADGVMKPVGLSSESLATLHAKFDSIHWLCSPQSVSPAIGVTGPVPRHSPYEDAGGDFFLDPRAARPDEIIDDASLWLHTPEGMIIVTGCCHAGLINTVGYIQEITGVNRIRAIIGGFHLLHASPERIEKTIAMLSVLACERIIPCHCTGDYAIGAMRAKVGACVIPGAAGMSFCFA
jgi:7,8-dihydropterin-6-yl-methyl-4-(beta-D-ribofuranosyl)aminobenzene 5'-phosphate synthase